VIDRIRDRVRDEDGVAALEFAIVSMVFLLFLYGILTYGFIFGLDQSLNHAAEEGARAAISTASDSAAITKAQDTAFSRLSWLGSRIQASDVVATVAACPNDTTVKCVTVTITYPWSTRPLVPRLAGLPAPNQMQAVAVVQLT
jgi:Flp pilus assembly protein TadG